MTSADLSSIPSDSSAAFQSIPKFRVIYSAITRFFLRFHQTFIESQQISPEVYQNFKWHHCYGLLLLVLYPGHLWAVGSRARKLSEIMSRADLREMLGLWRLDFDVVLPWRNGDSMVFYHVLPCFTHSRLLQGHGDSMRFYPAKKIIVGFQHQTKRGFMGFEPTNGIQWGYF